MSSLTARTRPRIFNLAWPLLVELLLTVALGVVGTALAARISDETGAAFAMANQVSATLFMLFRIIGAGVGVVVTQNLGAGQRGIANNVARAVLGASTWLGGVAAVVSVLGASKLMHLLNAPADVLPIAVPFLQTLAPALWLDAWNASMASVMRAHLRTRDTLVVLAAMHLTHLLLAIPLMQGWGILPAMGLPGFALALAISRAVGLVLHLWLWRLHLGIRPLRSDWWRLPRRELAAVLHIGLPGAGEGIVYRLAFLATISVAAQLGAKAVATQAYVLQLLSSVVMVSVAIGFAVEILVGHMIGAGDFRAAHKLVRKSLARGLILSLTLSTCVALAGRWLLGIFTKDPEILRNGAILIWMTVVLDLGRTFNLIVINALRAAGDARYPVLAGASSMIIVMGGGSWLLGVHFGLGLPGLWIAYAADEWIRGLLMWRRWSVQAWVGHARAVRRRLRD